MLCNGNVQSYGFSREVFVRQQITPQGVTRNAQNEALNALAALDKRKSKVVELRFFGGLSVEKVAEVLSVSPETVMRDWRLAKVWLLREMTGEKSVEG